MKVFLQNIALFVILSFAFSALTGCTSGGDSTLVNNAETPASNNASTGASPAKPKINYPPAPSAIMQSDVKLLDDSTFKLQDKKGKVVLVNLWATWCGPCIKEMPHLIAMHEKYKDKQFEVIGLNTDDETKEQIDKFAAEQKLNYPLGWADGNLVKEFIKVTRLQGIPQSLLINRDGQLTGMFVGGSPKVISDMKVTVEKIVNE